MFRATRLGLDALAPSTRAGRWAPADQVSVLYTSVERDGALAELAFHWSQLTPLPSKPAAVHRIRLIASRTFRLIEADLNALGVDRGAYRSINYGRTREIGAAVAFLECDGLIVPSARWACENVVLFTDNHRLDDELELLASEEVDWQRWARAHGMLEA